MRLIHPQILEIVATQCTDEDFKTSTSSRRQIISHASSEVSKYLATRTPHPKMFLPSDRMYGFYLALVKHYADMVGNTLEIVNFIQYDDFYIGFVDGSNDLEWTEDKLVQWFDGAYMFSDAVSLYYKGLNVFPYIYGEEWQKYCPVISLKEIQRQVNKTLDKNKK